MPNQPNFLDTIQEQTYVFIWPCKDFVVSNATEGSQKFFPKRRNGDTIYRKSRNLLAKLVRRHFQCIPI